MDSIIFEKRIKTMNAWAQRREDAHKPWTSDQLWNRINQNWPNMSDENKERLFQSVCNTRKGNGK